ncbi:hypothetical protein AGMMS49592_0490 [Endomicrobiia bacterium]|nr:hypothetical protein AGMMS49592_0490 [Endomicrobiia bacterium]
MKNSRLLFKVCAHEYFLNVDEVYRKIPSVTQICNLGKEPNTDIPQVRRALEYGKTYHEAISLAIKGLPNDNVELVDDYGIKVDYVMSWLENTYPKENFLWLSEVSCFTCDDSDYENTAFAGHCDLLIYEKKAHPYKFDDYYKEVQPTAIVEFKTGSRQKWHVAQLGGYYEILKADKIDARGYNNTDLLLVYIAEDNTIEVCHQLRDEVCKSFAEKHKSYLMKMNDDFKENELSKIDHGNLELIEHELDMISHLQSQIDIRQELVDKAKDALLSQMLEHGIDEFSYKNIKFKATQSHTRTLLDTKDLKEKEPDVYAAFSKTIDVKPSLRITKKEV